MVELCLVTFEPKWDGRKTIGGMPNDKILEDYLYDAQSYLLHDAGRYRSLGTIVADLRHSFLQQVKLYMDYL
jgi:hypothetical protein